MSCSRTQNQQSARRQATRINDNGLLTSQNTTCVLASRVFDAVRENLDASPCTLSLVSPAGTAPFNVLSAQSNGTFTQLSDLTQTPSNNGFRLVTCQVNSEGTCQYQDALGAVYTAPCVLSTDMECLLCFSEDALLPARPEVLCSLTLAAAQNTGDPNVFDALCDGVCLMMSVGEVPLYMPYSSQLAPADISCRTPYVEPTQFASLFPSPAPCTQSPGECG